MLIWVFNTSCVFVRKLKHKSGVYYIQVVEKLDGKYKVRKSFGGCHTEAEMEQKIQAAKRWMKASRGLIEIDFSNEVQVYKQVLETVNALQLVGHQLVLGKIFDSIGFNQIGAPLFKDLVLYRLVYPRSKLKTTEYLARFEQKYYTEDELYRFMDKFHSKDKEKVERISYEHTRQVLDQGIQIVFYDVTTVYFEIDEEDAWRKTGFSKEGKHQNPQIVLGLLVSKGGYPLAYDLFEGNQFEGHTMLPILEAFKKKYQLDKLIIVADSGLMSKENLEQLQSTGYEFMIGARIKNEKQAIKEKITSLKLGNGDSKILLKDDLKLILTYSDDRAKKDRYNREKGLRRLEKQLGRGKLTKANINNRGYNKFLHMEGELCISLNRKKIEEDEKWDGLKGYLTNSALSKEELLENYGYLWQIEKAFRVAKSELKLRPIFHYKQHRIEAHICLNFVAYKVYKELERLLKIKQSKLSPEKVIEILQSIYQIQLLTPNSKEKVSKILLLSKEHRQIAQLFDLGC